MTVMQIARRARPAAQAAGRAAALEQLKALCGDLGDPRPERGGAAGQEPRPGRQGEEPRRPSARRPASGPPQAAIDGDPKTYWDETDNQKLYWLRVTLKQPGTVGPSASPGFTHHNLRPADFEILCDGKVVKRVVGAMYDNNVFGLRSAADAVLDGRLEDHRRTTGRARAFGSSKSSAIDE